MQPTSRRRFLTGVATASAALAAGCSSGASDSGGGANGSGGATNTSESSSSGATTGSSGDANAGTAATSTGGSDSGATTTVAAGPDGRFVFEPAQAEVSVGDTVVWEFKSPSHNVSAIPEDSEEVSIPSGATPFASYESGNLYAVVPEGETYEHTFETPGEYTYVCIPHVTSGMVGTVTVTE